MAALALSGCTDRQTLRLRSAWFADGARIPARFTCDGANISPSLAWAAVPDGTGEVAIVMRDIDARPAGLVHWALAGVSPETRRLPDGYVAARATRLRNQLGTRGYRGPCPPPGDRPHRYVFTLYALSSRPQLDPDTPPVQAEQAIKEAAQAKGTLVGRYRRSRDAESAPPR